AYILLGKYDKAFDTYPVAHRIKDEGHDENNFDKVLKAKDTTRISISGALYLYGGRKALLGALGKLSDDTTLKGPARGDKSGTFLMLAHAIVPLPKTKKKKRILMICESTEDRVQEVQDKILLARKPGAATAKPQRDKINVGDLKAELQK